MKRAFKKLYSSDTFLTRFQDNIADVFSYLLGQPLNDYNIVSSLTLGASDTLVNHGLGRRIIGYIIINRNANETVYTSATSNSNPELFVILKASGTVIVDILFF